MEKQRGGHNKTHESVGYFPHIDSFSGFDKIISSLNGHDTGISIDDLEITYIPAPFGGRQKKYFICPECKARVRMLYLWHDGTTRFNGPGDFHLKCRKCAKLNYPSQQKRLGKESTEQKRLEKFCSPQNLNPYDPITRGLFDAYMVEKTKKKEKPPSQRHSDKALRQISKSYCEPNPRLNTVREIVWTLEQLSLYDYDLFVQWLVEKTGEWLVDLSEKELYKRMIQYYKELAEIVTHEEEILRDEEQILRYEEQYHIYPFPNHMAWNDIGLW